MGVTEGTVADTALLRRGNHLALGKVVPRQFPVFLAGEKQAPLPAKFSSVSILGTLGVPLTLVASTMCLGRRVCAVPSVLRTWATLPCR